MFGVLILLGLGFSFAAGYYYYGYKNRPEQAYNAELERLRAELLAQAQAAQEAASLFANQVQNDINDINAQQRERHRHIGFSNNQFQATLELLGNSTADLAQTPEHLRIALDEAAVQIIQLTQDNQDVRLQLSQTNERLQATLEELSSRELSLGNTLAQLSETQHQLELVTNQTTTQLSTLTHQLSNHPQATNPEVERIIAENAQMTAMLKRVNPRLQALVETNRSQDEEIARLRADNARLNRLISSYLARQNHQNAVNDDEEECKESSGYSHRLFK